ncbi:MAG TPA: hypothetical protein VHD15_17015 [Hyphomicrobiales bacterium]|nr:hypothetical protein [Hyphomicrobiales bacterium]
MRMVFVATAALALAMGSAVAPALAAGQQQCRDSNGKFMKCPPPAPTASRCRDNSSGKFVKCGTPGSSPVSDTKTKH